MAIHKGGYTFQDKEGHWFARITVKDSSGKRRNIKRRAKDKTEAKQLLRELVQHLELEGSKAVDAANMTFADLCDFYERVYLHPAEYIHETKVSGLRALDRAQRALALFRKHFGARRLRSITYGDIYEYRRLRLQTETQYKRPRAISSMNRELVVLRRILNIAVREDWLTKNPFNAGDPLISAASENKRERILTREEEAKLFAAIDAEPKREHLKGILLIALDCALRRGEIFKLRWSDINLDCRTITISAFNAKTARSRTVAMTLRVLQDLRNRWQSSRQEKDALVFGVKVTVRTSFAKACKAANLKGFNLHDCRHTAISRMIRVGTPPVEAMRVSGHLTMSAFYRYANIEDDTVFRAAAALDAFNGQPIEAAEVSVGVN